MFQVTEPPDDDLRFEVVWMQFSKGSWSECYLNSRKKKGSKRVPYTQTFHKAEVDSWNHELLKNNKSPEMRARAKDVMCVLKEELKEAGLG